MLLLSTHGVPQEDEQHTNVITFEDLLGEGFAAKMRAPKHWQQHPQQNALVTSDGFLMRVAYIRGANAKKTASESRQSTLKRFRPELRKEIAEGPIEGIMGISLTPNEDGKCSAIVHLSRGDLDTIIVGAAWKEVPTVAEMAEFEKALRTIELVKVERTGGSR